MLFTDVQRSARLNKKEKSTNTSPYPDEVIEPSGAGILPGHPCLLEQRGGSAGVCRVAGGTGSSYRQQRETERSRRGTPCCTYRYRLWSLAGCVHSGRTLFLFCP